MNEQLFDELTLLQERLAEKNIRLEDLDIASDTLSALSQSQAKFSKKFNNMLRKPQKNMVSNKSAAIKKENTFAHRNTSGSAVDIILEQQEEDLDNELEPLSNESSSPQAEIKRLQLELQKRNKAEARRASVLRAKSSVPVTDTNSVIVGGAQEASAGPNGRLDLLAAIDKVNDLSVHTTDCDQLSHLKSQVTQHFLEMRSVIEREDPIIQDALERIGRLQQVKRVSLDCIEKELFDDKYRVHQMIKLVDLASIFMRKLGLSQQQANSFSRFLCEETEDEEQTKSKVAYNPNLKINFPMVVVRLQTYSVYPLIYQD